MHESKLLLANISDIKDFHNIHVDIIIHFLKQNNLYLSSSIKIISQKQLNVDIFSGHGQSSLGQEQSQGWQHPLSVFAANIWTSEHNIRLESKHKSNIAHEYLSLFEYAVLECRLYWLVGNYSLRWSELGTAQPQHVSNVHGYILNFLQNCLVTSFLGSRVFGGQYMFK